MVESKKARRNSRKGPRKAAKGHRTVITYPAKTSVRTASERDALATELQALGFSDYEARTYIALLQSSPATAYEISRAAGLPRANTYGALESCTNKGAVQPFSQGPVRYIPVDPRVLLSRIADDTSVRCKQLAARLSQVKSDDSREFVWTIEGEEKVNAKISEMIREAKVHVWIKAHQTVIDAHYSELRDAAKRSVNIMIILFGVDDSRFRFGDNVRVYLHEGNGVRIGNADNLFTIATDFRTALTANMHGEVHAAYTRNKPIVTMAESLIRHDMYLAEIFQRFGSQIDEAFGPFLVALRRRYFSPQQLLSLNDTMEHLFKGAAQHD
ncbi:MAG: TrmB family transcriptional regulator [Candidatus Binataceae bacterium]|nr:TrmB family transcriptional regulator [Candidatus Binataceae bacterium]